MLDRLEFLLGEALVALRRNGLMTFAAVSTVTVALFLLGGLGYTYYRVSNYANSLTGKFEMRVFLQEGTSYDEIRSTAEQLRAIDGIKTVNWIPKEKAWEQKLKELPPAYEDLGNPFPDAFKVILTDVDKGPQVVEQIKNLTHVDDNGIAYLDEVQNILSQMLHLIRWIGITVGGLLFLTGGVLIYNAIRLTVLSRRLEIRIMQLQGASKRTIEIPFLIEGVLQGAVGGLAATFILLSTQVAMQAALVEAQIGASNPNILSSAAITATSESIGKSLYELPPFPTATMLMILLIVGAFYGFACSKIAVRTPLRFR